jgi:hypothetical protein
MAVEDLLGKGEVACVERRGFQRIYDLAENAIPAKRRHSSAASVASNGALPKRFKRGARLRKARMVRTEPTVKIIPTARSVVMLERKVALTYAGSALCTAKRKPAV